MSALSGKKTVAAAGTAESLGVRQIHGPLMVKALLANTENIYIGNNGSDDVSSANGLELAAGDAVIFDYVSNTQHIYIDADVNGEGVAWIRLDV